MRAPRISSAELVKWFEVEQAKGRRCKCGCGRVIVIQMHHRCHGIPEFIRGHAKRGKSVVQEWIKQEQGKHRCHCGCGLPITIQAFQHSYGIPKFRKGHCNNAKGKYQNTLEDFWGKVSKNIETSCWEWTGKLNNQGYGTFQFRGKRRLVHRISYRIKYGKFPKDLFVCHRCDNPKCVNPDHLFLGTAKDNMNDAAVKGRAARKYTADVVMKAVKLVRSGLNRKETAKIVGMSHALVVQIMNGWVWGHVTRIKKKERKRRGK